MQCLLHVVDVASRIFTRGQASFKEMVAKKKFLHDVEVASIQARFIRGQTSFKEKVAKKEEKNLL